MKGSGIRQRVEEAFDLSNSREAAHVFTLRLDEMALAEADAREAASIPGLNGPLFGMPITVKDNIDLAGHATTAGSVVLHDAPPADADAPVVSQLRRNGAIVLGRTTMTEFAFSGLGL